MRPADASVRLGREVARWQDACRPELDEERGLERLRRTSPSSGRAFHRRLLLASMALVVAVLVVLVVRRPLALTIDGTPSAGETAWLEGPTVATARFSDGSRVDAAARSRWRVQQLRADGATVQLERGELVASVESKLTSDWRFEAGPFAIQVTGTAFRAAWDPVDEVFDLAMTEGTVVLAGPVVGQARTVTAPERVRIDLRRRSLAVTNAIDPAEAPEPIATATGKSVTEDSAIEPPGPSGSKDDDEPSPATPTPTSPVEPAWRILAEQGHHEEALEALRKSGLVQRIESAGPGTLLEMAQVARLGGDGQLATTLLERLQQRYPDSAEAGTARFVAGKNHFDRGHDDEAIAALSGYLARGGEAAFFAEASVLLVIALDRSGRHDEARARARSFIARYPDGPHAERLRSIAQ